MKVSRCVTFLFFHMCFPFMTKSSESPQCYLLGDKREPVQIVSDHNHRLATFLVKSSDVSSLIMWGFRLQKRWYGKRNILFSICNLIRLLLLEKKEVPKGQFEHFNILKDRYFSISWGIVVQSCRGKEAYLKSRMLAHFSKVE